MFTAPKERKDLIILLELMDEVVGMPACANFPDAYFPEHDGVISYTNIKWAKSMCEECPIRTQCLEFAMKHPQQGIWGGLTSTERRRLKLDVSARSSSVRSAQGQSVQATKLQPSNRPAEQPSAPEQHS